MPVHRYVEENSSAAMLAAMRSAGVTPEVNLREPVTCLHQAQIRMPTLALKLIRDGSRSPKQGYQWPHKKGLCPINFLKKQKRMMFYFLHLSRHQSSPQKYDIYCLENLLMKLSVAAFVLAMNL